LFSVFEKKNLLPTFPVRGNIQERSSVGKTALVVVLVLNGPHCEYGKVESRNMPRIVVVLLRKGVLCRK
jgi:hypothetical protein